MFNMYNFANKRTQLALYLLLALFSTSFSMATEIIKVDESLKHMEINNQTEYLIDKGSTLTLEDMMLLENNSFKKIETSSYKLGLLSNNLWIRFKIDNTGYTTPILTLTSAFYYITFYIPHNIDNKIEYRDLEAGIYSPRENYPYRYPVIKIPEEISPNDYIYIRINPLSRYNQNACNFTISLSSDDHFFRTSALEIAVYFLIFGALIAVTIYNFFLSISLKSVLYGKYVLYILGILFYLSLKSRMFTIWGASHIHILVIPSIAVTYILGMNFSRTFLETKRNSPLIDKLIIMSMAICVIVLALYISGHPGIANSILYILAILGPMIFISSGIVRLKQGYTPARYYLLAWLTLGIATLITGISGKGIVIPPFFNQYILGLGSVCESLLLSLALGDKINVIQQEKLHLTEIAAKDELTGLFNQRTYHSSIKESIKKCRQNKTNLSLMVLDIDNFKSVNDEYGHKTGDYVLKNLSTNISSCTRPGDICCRYGGEEFAVILRDTTIEEARNVAERLRRQFAQSSIVYNEIKINRTVSIGVAELMDDDNESTLFDRADMLLYKVKKSGKNRTLCQQNLLQVPVC